MTRGQLLFAASALMVLNAVDALFTLGYVGLGFAEEANPLMAVLLSYHPLVFTGAKLLLVNGFVVLCWAKRDVSWVRTAVCFGLVIYMNVVSYHLAHLMILRELN